MDFLDKLVLPQSAHHMVLLKYLLVLTYLIFIPYLSLLIGTNILSVFYNRRAARTNDPTAYKFAKELVDIVTFNRSVVLGLGVVPLLSSVFCYAQLLHLSPLNTSGYLIISIIFFLIGISFLYSYKNSFHLKDILKAASDSVNKDQDLERDINNYTSKAKIAFEKFGVYSLIALLFSTYIFTGTVKLAADPSRWESTSSVIGVIFSLSSLLSFSLFVVFSLLITASVILFFYFRPNSETEITTEKVKELAKNSSMYIGLISTIIFPVFLLLNVYLLPHESLSFGIFALLIVIMFIVIVIANLFYLMIKSNSTKYSTSLLFLILLLVVTLTVKDQFAFDTSSQLQFNKLVANYDEYQTKLKEEMGGGAVEISGVDIYNGRCIACHQFDNKLVGPAYNDILSKYENDMQGLTKFILNPVKINPEFPSMPNQGLKPNEAKAIAEYIMTVYKENQK